MATARSDLETPLAMPPGGARPQAGMTSAASKGYALVSSWESSAPLSEKQLVLISTLASECSVPPFPKHCQEAAQGETPELTSTLSEGSSLTLPAANGDSKRPAGQWEDTVLHSAHQFYKWHSELEAARRRETEDQYARYLTTLSDRLTLTDDVTARVDSSLSALSSLQGNHATVTKNVERVKRSCERLMHEKDMLVQYADALGARLGYFDELEAISTEFNRLGARAENTNVMPLLSRLDDCLTYMGNNPQYVDTMSYTLQLRQLQGKALGLILQKVQQVMQRATEAVREDLAQSLPAGTGPGPAAGGYKGASFSNLLRSGSFAGTAEELPELTTGAAAALLSVRFRSVCEPLLGPILHELRQRSRQAEYQRLLDDCEQAYCSARAHLVLSFVQRHVQRLQTLPLPDLTREGCAYLLEICRTEVQLARVFFPGPGISPALAALAETLCTELYDALRPRYILIRGIDELVDIINILRQESTPDAQSPNAAALPLLAPTLNRTIADVQERLIYRVQTFLREEVADYQPTPEDTDFPRCLALLQESARLKAEEAAGGTDRPMTETDGDERPTGSDGDEALPVSDRSEPGVLVDSAVPRSVSDAGAGAVVLPSPAPPPATSETGPQAPEQDDYSTWYPPLRRTLLVLAKLYCSIELPAFSGLGQDALKMCTQSIQQAAKQVLRNSGPLDSQLFTIRHLLLLREQIAPFDADFVAADRDLDFSHMRGQLRRVMAGEMPLFNFTSQNAVVQMVTRGGLRVLEHSVDSKKELEKTLKGCCEAFIMTVTKAVVEPMLSFITKVTALRVSTQGKANTKPVSEHAFASPEKLAVIVAAVNKALDASYPMAIRKMQLYLEKPKTQAVLLKPITNNIIEAHGQIAQLLATSYDQAAAATVPLHTSEELETLLNAVIVAE